MSRLINNQTKPREDIINASKNHRLHELDVCSRTNAIPVQENDNGVVLVSGFSPSVIKMVLSNEVDPYKALMGILNSERYAEIRQRLVGEYL